MFVFDEAHLLFDDCPPALLQRVEQVVRLIRSKGVGVYFCSKNPDDIPEDVLGQLGNRIQHALRAYTPRDQKAVRAAAETFRPNKNLDTAQVITELGKGEALVSFLEGNGVPSMVERTMIRAPSARIGPVTPEERKAVIAKSPCRGKYETAVDSESAYEKLQARVGQTAAPADAGGAQGGVGGMLSSLGGLIGGIFGTNRARGEKLSTGQLITREITRSVANRVAGQVAGSLGKSIGGSMGNTIGRAIVRGTLGGMLRR